MPDLSFQVLGTECGTRGLIPLLYFRLRIASTRADEKIASIILRTQIQLEPGQRSYNHAEKERLGEIFGTSDRWGQTLRNKLWAHVDLSVPAFVGQTEVRLPVPCSYDLNVLSAKYFQALEGGDVALLFLFSGTVFHLNTEDRLQVHQISWEKECRYTMPAEMWRSLMEEFYPQSAWLTLRRDVFDRVYTYKRQHGFSGWDETLEHLLAAKEVTVEVQA